MTKFFYSDGNMVLVLFLGIVIGATLTLNFIEGYECLAVLFSCFCILLCVGIVFYLNKVGIKEEDINKPVKKT